jgi:hypothetical protein
MTISLNDPCFQDESFRFSYVFDGQDLKESLLLTGLIYPPWGIGQKGQFLLVSGWKRVLTARELGWKTIPVLVAEETDREKIWQRLILENKAHRQLSLVDKAFIIKKMVQMGISKEKVVKEGCSWLDIPPRIDWVKVYIQIAELDFETLQLIYDKRLPEFIVRFLFGYTTEERLLLLPWLRRLSQSKIKEVLESLKEMALRDHLQPEQIVADFKKSCPPEEMAGHISQVAEKFRIYLQEKRFPHYCQTMSQFKSILTEIGWPQEIKITPFPYFEKDEFQVSFSFSKESEFRDKVIKLFALAKTRAVKKLFFLKNKNND